MSNADPCLESNEDPKKSIEYLLWKVHCQCPSREEFNCVHDFVLQIVKTHNSTLRRRKEKRNYD